MEKLQRPCGVFQVSLRKSDNPQMRTPWVYAVLSPNEEKFQGSARSKKGADRAIRKIVAREEALLLRVQKDKEQELLAIRDLRRAGLDQHAAQMIASKESLHYKELAPGQILCSYKSGWRGERKQWKSQIFLQGREVSSSRPHHTRYRSERQAIKGLQKFYEQEALEEL